MDPIDFRRQLFLRVMKRAERVATKMMAAGRRTEDFFLVIADVKDPDWAPIVADQLSHLGSETKRVSGQLSVVCLGLTRRAAHFMTLAYEDLDALNTPDPGSPRVQVVVCAKNGASLFEIDSRRSDGRDPHGDNN